MKRRLSGKGLAVKTSITLTPEDDTYLRRLVFSEAQALTESDTWPEVWPTRSSVLRRVLQEHRLRNEKRK